MKPGQFLCLGALLLLSCTTTTNTSKSFQNDVFINEMQTLKEYFQIPGLAIRVQKGDSVLLEKYLGYADLEKKQAVNSKTSFPIASITKMFSGVALLQLAEQQKLSLDDPITAYLDTAALGDSVLVKHVLSHTSQGAVGQHFYYSYRFGALTTVIEKASGKSFSDYLEEAIFKPLELQQTSFLIDSTQLPSKMAMPYMLDDAVVPGPIEYGASASAGMVSTLADLSTFSRALDSTLLLSTASRKLMFTPAANGLPYGYGVFSQEFADKKLLWAYGQYDAYSSLLLKVPEDDITLVLLANNNLMSDPARLINGDITTSLFALSFLKNFTLALQEMPLLEGTKEYTPPETVNVLYRKKLLAEALSASFLARFDDTELEKSKQLLRKTFKLYPDVTDYGNLNLLHTLTFLKSVYFYKDLGEFNEFDPFIEGIAKKLLEQDSTNPYVHVYMGTYYDRKGNLEKARFHFEALVSAQNFAPFWYTAEAKQWLANQSN